MEDGETNEGDTQGKEVINDTPKPEAVVPKPEEVVTNVGKISDLDRAEASNKEKARLLEEDKKLMDRKEKLQAIQMVGGHTNNINETKKEETAEEYTERFERGEIDLTK